MGTAAEPPSDAELLRRVAAAEPDALRALYDRHAPWLLLRLRQRCADPALVDEVLQDTFLSVWRSAGRFSGGEVGAWIWTIAARRLVDAYRRRAREGRLPVVAATAAPAAEEEALRDAVGDELEHALRRLAPELRQVLQAMVLDGLTVRETSVLLGLPEGTVKTRARRARILLREALS